MLTNPDAVCSPRGGLNLGEEEFRRREKKIIRRGR